MKYLKLIIYVILLFSIFSICQGGFVAFFSDDIASRNWGLLNTIGGVIGIIVVAFVIMGYWYFKFGYSSYHKTILAMEYYFGILKQVKNRKDTGDEDFDELSNLCGIENLIGDIILYYSKDDSMSFDLGIDIREKLLPRVKERKKNYYHTIKHI